MQNYKQMAEFLWMGRNDIEILFSVTYYENPNSENNFLAWVFFVKLSTNKKYWALQNIYIVLLLGS